ncbi:acyl carrier protein [Pandoraea nosoerga]|uniref:Acyl carrier protein n=1 Tax=Pandoraea nosoerga TaxID=2508296 RepID=A0A5E4VRQ0_9BURK|nr:acyl carrier protein [Pandoraea nosoerga]MBN4667977.1 acyl carrier protein [Pandoraea nosoerga]MBN4677877.1 acyl carrier protein [Pandoraea nosoerga]MBN4683066.1 acyl carrier protein [Pandoraea nosoerga]MBN4747039.1 acyl carrier protein [Pandoraea nosoerga]VVE15127.1 acyl carrier protein [Pandoraea nosoerga]
MNLNDIENKVAEIVGNIVLTHVEPDTLLIDSGLVDSLSAVDVVLAVEREFGVKVPPSEIDVYLVSVSTLAAFIAEQKGA